MDFLEADQILSDFGEVLANPGLKLFWSERELKNTKEEILLAFKIWYIRMVKYHTLSQEEFELHRFSISSISLFFPHEEALLLNNYDKAIENLELEEFLKNHPGADKLFSSRLRKLTGIEERQEVMKFVDSIIELDKQDPLYYQKAYTLANTEYRTEYKETFDDPQAAYNKRIAPIKWMNDREIQTSKKNKQVLSENIDTVKKEDTKIIKINSSNSYKEVKWIFLSLIVLIAILMLIYYIE